MLLLQSFLLIVLSLLIQVAAIPTPTLPDHGVNAVEAEYRRWAEDHQRYHRSVGESARPSSSPSPGGARKRSAKPISLPSDLPLGTPEDLFRCPSTQLACPVTDTSAQELLTLASSAPFECVSPLEDLYSCGGCATLGTGRDCTAIPGVVSVSCAIGSCNVHSCEQGYVISSDGHGCVLGTGF
ncbi:hypothetical protein IAU60_003049 [Kwoniella sp. DSM 27419]